MTSPISVDQAIELAGVGRFQKRLLGIFGLVWTADAMQVLAIGFTVASIAVTFGVGIPEALRTGTAFFLGMLVGAFVLGRLADRIGRRPVLLGAIVIDAVFGIASAFAPDLTWLIVLRFLTGVGVGGTLPVDYAMMAEFLPAQRRGRWLVGLESFWAVGTVALALLALAVSGDPESWRTIFLVTSLPALAGIVLRLSVPESPFYLNKQGRTADAHAVLRRVARSNGQPDYLPPLKPDTAERQSAAALFSPSLRRRSILILLAWLLISMSYYGVFVYLPVQLARQGFGFLRGQEFLVVIALAQLPGYALAAYGIERWGRRPTLTGFLLFSAAGCLLYGLGQTTTVVVAATLLMSFSLLGCWASIYAYTPEIYPTTLRATGMGSAGAVARFGGLLAPSVLAPVMAASFGLSLVAFSVLLVLAAGFIALIDVETRNSALR
ncbi:MFS transporter [Orrella dioscoreae]|uniref:Niacin transporter NiaP n=1 Tax=Orrella dioscoreae TaxID=1851544 RepID=A0A1C3JYI9_9BURK|nr:MFS transporter [Orrella dioscoreae]SBT24310.1 Niacin transporter NiaP [Orrella dioscoreae]SOE49817.1 Niacin transporter NiaP [Orrella dioscoreae]